MTHFLESLILGAVLSYAWLPALAESSLEGTWLGLIQADFDKHCAVERLGVGSTLVGYNGFRSEQWFVRTCIGDFEYEVAFYPPSAFPDRASPYEVKQVPPANGSRPNNSFKPKPLRGSA